jgi:hypothetical protein
VPTGNVAPGTEAPIGTRTAKLPAAAAPATLPGAVNAPLGSQTQKLPATALPTAPAPPPVAVSAPPIAVSAPPIAVSAPPIAVPAPPIAVPAPPAQVPPAQEAELAIHIEIEELPPESKPSGIGEKYVPKEEGAPPVVLDDEVRAAELRAQAALEAQHHARRAPTILKLKAVELPNTLVSAEPYVPPRKSGYGRLLGFGAIVALVAGGVVVFFGRGKPRAGSIETPTATAAKVAPDTAAPPPPPPPVETASVAPTAAPAPEAPSAAAADTAEPTPAPSAKHPAALKHPATGPASKPSPAPRPAPTPKTPPAAARPASKPAGAAPKPTGGKAVIVRDSPF